MPGTDVEVLATNCHVPGCGAPSTERPVLTQDILVPVHEGEPGVFLPPRDEEMPRAKMDGLCEKGIYAVFLGIFIMGFLEKNKDEAECTRY
eukprot:1825007-Rhodomonas_salina.1